jgi:hypothetical protein
VILDVPSEEVLEIIRFVKKALEEGQELESLLIGY